MSGIIGFLQCAVGAPGSTGQGMAVTSVALGSAAGLAVSDPGNPQANAQGDVREANISTSQQLVNLVQAQNDYQANARAGARDYRHLGLSFRVDGGTVRQ